MAMSFFAKTAAVLTLACSAVSGTAFADAYHHVDKLSATIEGQARLLEREMVVYRWSREYIHLLADTRQMSRAAARMHDIAHAPGCLDHLQADLRQLDAAFHHLQSTIDRVEEDCFRRDYGPTGSALHLRRLLRSIELNICHLQSEVRCLSRLRHRESHYRPAIPGWWGDARYYPTRPNPWSRQITIGGGSTRFTIRF